MTTKNSLTTVKQQELREVRLALEHYALLHEITVREALGFLSRRSALSIILELLGLNSQSVALRQAVRQEFADLNYPIHRIGDVDAAAS